MSQYVCDFLKSSDFPSLKTAWECLEKGKDMTFYQSFEWFEMLYKKNRKYFFYDKIFWGVVKDSLNNIVLIAPLFIKKSFFPIVYKKGVYFYGMGGFSDYSNFIYDDVNDEVFRILFTSIIKNFGIIAFYFDYLKEDTKLYDYVRKNTIVEHDYCGNCVGLTIPNSINDYNELLSKNARQNIRTAFNRMEKDNINFLVNFDDPRVNISEFEMYRNERVKKKRVVKFNLLSIKLAIMAFYDDLRIQTKKYYPYKDLKISKFLTVTDMKKNKMMSAVNYGYCKYRKEIVAMSVSLNEEYKRYSPGIIGWYQFIISNMGNDYLKFIDFTRGDENYKYVLGGTTHHLHFIKFYIK